MRGTTKLLGSWGVTVTLAWLVTQILDWYPELVAGAPVSTARVTIGIWFVLMLPPVILTILKMRDWNRWAPFLLLWLVITVGGTLQNTVIANIDTAEPIQIISYIHLWFGLCTVGFAYTAAQFHNHSRTVYSAAAILNATIIPALFLAPALYNIVFLIAAIIQGLPMLIDLGLTYRTRR